MLEWIGGAIGLALLFGLTFVFGVTVGRHQDTEDQRQRQQQRRRR